MNEDIQYRQQPEGANTPIHLQARLREFFRILPSPIDPTFASDIQSMLPPPPQDDKEMRDASGNIFNFDLEVQQRHEKHSDEIRRRKRSEMLGMIQSRLASTLAKAPVTQVFRGFIIDLYGRAYEEGSDQSDADRPYFVRRFAETVGLDLGITTGIFVPETALPLERRAYQNELSFWLSTTANKESYLNNFSEDVTQYLMGLSNHLKVTSGSQEEFLSAWRNEFMTQYGQEP